LHNKGDYVSVLTTAPVTGASTLLRQEWVIAQANSHF